MSLYFLMCSERSGSNFLTRLMNGHSNICGPATKHLFNPVTRNLFRYEPLSRETRWHALLEDIDRLLNAEFSIWQSRQDANSLKALAPVGDIATLLRNVFLEEARIHGKQHVFIKENQIYEFMPFLLRRFPESKYIFQTRDPRDMALSWKKNPSHPGGIVAAARRWQQDQQKYMMLHNELSHGGLSAKVRYEDLIENTEAEMTRLLGFLGHAYETDIMDFYKDELTQKNSNLQQAWNNLGKAVIRDNKEKFRKDLSELEIRIIEKICYHEMILLGYSPDNTKQQLDSVEPSDIAAFEHHEKTTLVQERAKSVDANMLAKQVFYQRLIADE